ncbi:hypothetical protein [Heyndrickxia acidiproducens]|uniref:hypothetical protein n=1 Tax=Heyndrickxia acidiproducens TaxID=1121084 RepID=UPI00036D9BAB|nr:hypothetical protein [Heyndrickxia acidiproducens]
MGIEKLLDREVDIELSGSLMISGMLIDVGTDLLVLYDGNNYHYVPFIHIHSLKEKQDKEISEESAASEQELGNNDPVSYRKILTNAKGRFVRLTLSDKQILYGYIASVLNDYLVFYSPVFKTILVAMQHVKWLTPYPAKQTPYGLADEDLPVKPINQPFARSFEEQLKKYEGTLLVFDLDPSTEKTGVLQKKDQNMLELSDAYGETVFLKLSHIKCVYVANHQP